MKAARSKVYRVEDAPLRAIAVLAFVGGFLISGAAWAADPFVADGCPQQVNARQILESATSKARSYGYDISTMFMQFEGPMHWETVINSKSDGVGLLPPQVEQWKGELTGRCLWFVYFGCEPPHVSEKGYGGCTDYPPTLWLLIDSGSGKILRSARYTGGDARLRIDE